MIDVQEKLSIRRQCQLLRVNRSTLFYKKRCEQEETALANEILEMWMVMPFYGYRRVTAELKQRGYEINHKRVQRMMKEMKITALYPKPRVKAGSGPQKYPYLLKDLLIHQPNQVWATDITYIKLPGGFVYLVALMDVYSRFIVSWRLSTTLDVSFCLEMLREGLLNYGSPEILNTDQGCQFTSQAWISCVEGACIRISMDGQGRWADNVYIERFWRTVKQELVFLERWSTVREARASLGRFIVLYNTKRLHQSLGYQTPGAVYQRGKG
jgi:putative transposase